MGATVEEHCAAFPEIAIRDAERSDIPAFIEFGNAMLPPEFHSNQAEIEFGWDPKDPRGLKVTKIGHAGGKMVVFAEVSGTVRGEPHDMAQVMVAITPEFRRRGLGRTLYGFLEEKARELGFKMVVAPGASILDGSEPFCHAMGMSEMNRDWFNELDLTRANLEPFKASAERLQGEGYEFFRLCERDTPEMRQMVHELTKTVKRDIPTGGTPFPDTSYEAWETIVFGGGPSYGPAQIWLAAHQGKPIGMTGMSYQSSGVAATTLTGVLRDHRGRGLAGALKYFSLTQALRDGYTRTMTGNAQQNAPILAINEKLGYKRGFEIIEFEKKLD